MRKIITLKTITLLFLSIVGLFADRAMAATLENTDENRSKLKTSK